tara:strand:- start:127 stop:825 length:699 start_codon:yes stop_codon:yes gene_type:complete
LNLIDISFDVFSDTPKGKDPDTYSPTLRKYHQILWGKRLPSGVNFDLDDNFPRKLHHKSELGEFFLSSDAIGHTYRDVKKMSHIVDQIPPNEMNSFFSVCSTIGAFIMFPSKKIDNKMTINAARGTNHKIKDRFDLTLECIRRFYLKENSPLSDTLRRYFQFLDLFEDFKGYVDFFLLQDLVEQNYSAIKYWHPFNGFDNPPLPSNFDEYQSYKTKVIDFVNARNKRILSLT